MDWCGQAALSSSSRSIVLNGVTVTGSFNYATSGKAGCTNHASSTGTVTLAVGSNSLFASIDDATPNTGSASADYTLMPAANHLIDTAPHNGSNLDVSKCIANCGGDVVLTYSTPAYRSMDTDRSLTFVYRDIQSHPTATITLNVQDTSHTRTVDVISMKVLDPGGTVVGDVKGGPERFFYNLPHQWMRLAARFIVGSPTGAYDYSAVITSYYTDGTSASTTVPVRILVTNEQGSPYGGGWTIAGVQRVYPQANGSIVLTDGTGTVQYYAGPCASAPCSYVTPRGEFSVLSRHSWGDGTLYDRRAPDGSVVAFGSDGRAAYAQDRFGNRTSYSYDPSGRLAGVTDPVGKVIYIASAGTSPYGGPILTITDPGNRVTTLNLNSSNDLVSIVDPAGGQPFQNGSYWSGHYLKAWQDRRGGIWGANRDCAAHVSSIASPLLMGDTVRTLMTHQDVQTTGCAGTNGRGDRTAPATASVPDSVRAIVTNPRGYATRYAVDVFGAPTRIEDALGRATIIQRDSMSRVTRVVTPSGHTVASTWTGPNVTQAVDSTTGRTINYAYDARYNLQLTVSGQAVATTNYLNAAGTLIDSTRVGGAAATRYRYDSRGRDTLTTDPEGHATRTHFDSAWGSADIVASGGGRLMAYAFDGMGRVTGTADALYDRSTTAYDVLNRVRYSVGPRGDTTTFSYDSLFLWKVVDALHQAYQYDRNALGWVETLTDPGSRADHFAYDQNGNVTSHTNRRGQMVTTAYDQLDRPTQLAAAPADTTRYAYDPSDHWTSASNAASVDTLKFDGAGRTVAEIVWRAGRRLVDSSYYNSLGLRSLVRWDMDSLAGYVKHGTAYGYDQSGQLDSLIPLPSGGLTSLGFNGDRLATTVAFPTGVIQSSTFSSIHQSSQTTYSPAGSAIDLAFQRAAYQDSLGRIGERYTYPTGSDTSRVYAYDGAGQLIGYTDQVVAAKICHPQLDLGMVCTQPNPQLIQQETYSYDLVGNRTDSATAVQAGNRLPSFHGYTLAYDADGNLVSKNKAGVTDSLEWNALGQLTRVRRNGAVVAEFAYDGFGRRISKTAAGTTRFYQWDGDNIVTERDAAMSILVEYAFYPGEDAPHSVQAGGASYVVATEAPGHVIGLMSASGTGVAAAYRYRPFGLMEHDDQTIPNSLRFQGRPYDAETGLYYFRARYYDPELGRFVSEDPIGLEGGVNQYAYAGNDPVNGRDPMGLDSCGNCGGWEWPFSWETFLAMIHQNHQGDDGSGGGGSGGGGSSNPKPDVVKNSKRVMACNRSANTVMAALQHNFTDFASFSSSYTPALAFNAPSQLGVGTSIPISMFAPINGTVISYNTSVTVKSMSPTSLTFVTVPGHSLYPATISFSASGAGQSQIQFGVDIRGNFANLGWEAGYYLGGSLFEDAVWSNLMDNVATFCGSKQ